MNRTAREQGLVADRRMAYTGAIVLLVLVTVLVVGVGLSRRLYEQSREHAIESLRSISALKTEELSRWVEETTTHLAQPPSAMIAVTFERWLKSGGRPGPDAERLQYRLEYLKGLSKEHSVLWLFDLDGGLRMTSRGAFAHPVAHYPGVIEKALRTRQPVLVDFHREFTGQKEPQVALELLVPLFVGQDGSELRPVGFLLYQIDPQAYLYPMLGNWPAASRSAETVLFRIEGDDTVPLSPLRHDPAAPLTLRRSQAMPGLLATQAARGAGPVIYGVDYRGVPSVGVISRVPAMGWYLLAKIDDAEVFAEARQTAFHVAGVAGVALLTLLALGALILRRGRERTEAARLTAELEHLRAAEALFASEARYRAIVDSQSWEICRWKPDTTLTFVNSAFALARATPAESLIGQRWRDFVPAGEWQRLSPMIEDMLAGHPGKTHENAVLGPDGEEIWMSWTDIPIYGAGGKIVEFQSIGIDITQRKQADLSLQVSEQRLTLALEAANEGLWEWELPTGRAYLSPTYYAMLGYQAGEFPATFMGWTALLHPDDLAPLMGELTEEVSELHDDFELEFRLRAKDGGWRWMRGHGKVVARDADGLPSRIIGINLDVTAQRAQEAERRLLFESIAAARNEIYLIDGNSRKFRFVNQGALDNLGFTLEQMRAMTPVDISPYETAETFAASIAPLLSGEETMVKVRIMHRRADGSLYPAGIHVQYFRHQDEAYFLAIVEDLSEREAADAALRESESRFRTIFDTIHEGIFIHDDESGAVLAVNRRACEMYGRSEAEMMAATVADLSEGTPPYSQYEAVEWMMKAATGQPQIYEWHARRKSGELFWVEVNLRLTTIGEQSRLLAVVRDVTSRKAQEDELRRNLEHQVQLNKKLEEAQSQLLQSEKMASIGQLAAGVAHELNNPIGFVHSNLGTLDKYLKDIFEIADAYEKAEAAAACSCAELERVHQLKQDRDYGYLRDDIFQLMAESRDGLSRVRKIVQDLKDFSRVGEAEWQWADLHKGIDSTLNIVWNELKYKCKVTKEYGELPEVYCLPSQLNQVFMNLLVNAGHAIETKGEIAIRTGRNDGEVWVAIADTGKGIPKENMTRIFDPFFTTKPVGQGTGLGLSLAYGIVQKHKGRIEVDSEVGVGTTFRIVLPIEPAVAPAEKANP